MGSDIRAFARELDHEDYDLLATLDGAYAEHFALEPIVSRGCVSFFCRSGHSFVGMRATEPMGFVLAQSIWNGVRPCVYINRLVTADAADNEAYMALVAAVVKSAYDAAVYDLSAAVPHDDHMAQAALKKCAFTTQNVTVFSRILGSRGTSGEALLTSDAA